MKHCIKIICIIFILFSQSISYTQTSNWKVYDQSNTGLPTDEVYSVTTDEEGNIWLATIPDHDINNRGGGIVKYDGQSWTWYNIENSGLTSLYTDFITVDKNNHLWGTYYGGHVFHYDNNSWEELYHPTDSIYLVYKTAIIVDSNNTKWFASQGLYSFDDNTWTHYPCNLVVFDCMAQDKQGNFWVYSQTSNGIGKFNGSSWTYYTPNNSGLPNLPITSIEIDNNNIKYFGTDENGIIRFDDSTWTVFNPVVNGQTIGKINSLKIDSNNILWIGADNNLFIYDGSEFSVFYLSQHNIYANSITSIYIDKNNHKYFTFYNDGFAYQNGTIWNWYSTRNTGISIRPYKLQMDTTDNLWIGTWGFGVINHKNNAWIVYNMNNSILPGDAISFIYCDKHNNIWISALSNSGYTRINGGQVTRITSQNSGLPSNNCYYMTMDNQDIYWIASSDSGLIRYDGLNWTAYNLNNGRFPVNAVLIIKPDDFGNLWIYSVDKLIKFDGINWTEYNSQNSGLPSNIIVTDICVNALNDIYIGTRYSGLVRMNGLSWEIYNSQNSALPSNQVNCLTKDNSGNLWIGSYDGGIASFDGQNWVIINSSNSPLPNDNVFSILIDKENNKWITTDENLSVYNESGLTDIAKEILSVKDYLLYQNFPNPFNPSTTIRYKIPQAMFVKLKLYDLLGREVATLVNEEKSAGSFEVEFHGNGLSSGLYFYHLQAGNFIETKKMILIK